MVCQQTNSIGTEPAQSLQTISSFFHAFLYLQAVTSIQRSDKLKRSGMIAGFRLESLEGFYWVLNSFKVVLSGFELSCYNWL
jgi:hypothetical protein